MADSKIDFSFENLHFSCEGDNAWVEKQLNNVLSRIPALLSVHKKGENIVEEVIEVKEEDVKEVGKKSPRVGKIVKKPQAAATPDKEKTVKEKKVREPKVKEGKASKAAKVPAEPVAEKPKTVKEDLPARRGRKVKVGETPAKKAKTPKKKVVRKPFVEQKDSPLYRFIEAKKGLHNQVRKFLATAVFLARNNDLSKLSTPMISKTLKSYGIAKLQNASDCLNKNEKKGYCIKEGKEFIITENGYLSIE